MDESKQFPFNQVFCFAFQEFGLRNSVYENEGPEIR